WLAPRPPTAARGPPPGIGDGGADGAAHRLAAAAGVTGHEEPVLPAGLVEHGLGLFRQLPRGWDGEPALLATDLHPDNVLLSCPDRDGALTAAGGVGKVGAVGRSEEH